MSENYSKVSLSLPQELIRDLDLQAEAEKRSRSNMAAIAISEFLKSLKEQVDA